MDIKLLASSIAIASVVCVVVTLVIFKIQNKTVQTVQTTRPIQSVQPAQTVQSTQASIDDDVTIPPARLSEYGLTRFAFEHKLLGPGIKPDANAKMTRVSAAEDSAVLVSCSMVNGYAVRWMNRFLTVNTDGSVEWSDRRGEPDSCWKLEPGYCGDGEFVMMKSLFNNNFLRVDGATNKLVCVDKPSTESAIQYCWRLKPTGQTRRRCGRYYDVDYGRVIDVPCEIVQDPPEGGSCLDVTPGFVAKCCLKHNSDNCRSVVAREVVGRTVNEAGLYLKTRFPNHRIELCADDDDACQKANPFPIHDSNKWVLKYNKRLGTVTFPAYRFF
jgi:hypothetical protein